MFKPKPARLPSGFVWCGVGSSGLVFRNPNLDYDGDEMNDQLLSAIDRRVHHQLFSSRRREGTCSLVHVGGSGAEQQDVSFLLATPHTPDPER